MEVSPKTLREVEFREKKIGGYHPDDVDEFLERVAVGIEVYQEKLRQSSERVNHLERQLADMSKQLSEAQARAAQPPPAPPPREPDEQLKRTLLLAQKTADMAVAEAKQEAEQISAKAKSEARTIVDKARGEAAQITTEADKEAQSRIGQLDSTRATLEAHVRDLKKYLETEHSRLKQGLLDAARLLEENASRVSEMPAMTGTAAPTTPPAAHAPPSPPATPSGSAREAVRQMLAATGQAASSGDR